MSYRMNILDKLIVAQLAEVSSVLCWNRKLIAVLRTPRSDSFANIIEHKFVFLPHFFVTCHTHVAFNVLRFAFVVVFEVLRVYI
jgi:hypothetical protein